MNATELVNILKSPTSKVICFGTAIIVGALLVIPMLNRDDDPNSVRQETELKQEEKAPLDIGSDIPRFKLDKRAETDAITMLEDGKPPVINDGIPKKSDDPGRKELSGKVDGIGKAPSASRQTAKKIAQRQQRKQQLRERDLSARDIFDRENKRNSGSGERNAKGTRIFVLSASQTNADAQRDEVFLSERYAPFGRLLDCKLVNTLESNVDGTPLIALVISDLWWTNPQGERKLIIPAGTEVHGKMGSCVRNRMMCAGNFVLVWQITSGEVGLELQIQGRVLEKSNQPGKKDMATITDMAAGLPGRVMSNNDLNEMLQYTMAFAQGLSAGFKTTTTYDNGSSIVSENDGSTKNALATAFESLSSVALENITDKISRESYFVRVAAGTEFYLYIEQVINIEKAAIADTVLNNLEQLKLAQGKNLEPAEQTTNQTSLLHDALGQAIPKSLQKELKGIR